MVAPKSMAAEIDVHEPRRLVTFTDTELGADVFGVDDVGRLAYIDEATSEG